MKQIKLFAILLSVLTILMFSFTGCNTDNAVEPPSDNGTDEAAIKQIIEEDETISSFEPNYNEEDAMDISLGKVNTEIYPVRVGQRMRRSEFNVNINFSGDTAYIHIEKTFIGKLFIAASYDPFQWGDSNIVDTVIVKDFTTTITRNVIMQKVRNTDIPRLNWKVTAISLPEGGTQTENVQINKLTVFLPDGSTIEVTDPNEYYLTRETGLRNQIPYFNRGDEVTVQVEVQSAYPDTDFVSLTYGADKLGMHRSKKLFTMISEEFDGSFYQRVYEQTWTIGQRVGNYHAVVNAMPKQVLHDDAVPVEENSWGMPYRVR